MATGDYSKPIEPVHQERQIESETRLLGDTWVLAQSDKAGQKVNDQTYATPGVFGEITMPSNWDLTRRGGNGAPNFDYLYTFKPPAAQGDVEISILNRGGALSQAGARGFNELLEQNKDITAPRILFDKSWPSNDPRAIRGAELIRDLAEVLGRNHQGDNQFTNNIPFGSARAPGFHIDRMELREVNGKVVLSIEGESKNKLTGATAAHFSGIYAPNRVERFRSDVTEVHQMYLYSADGAAFSANKPGYNRALRSIQW
ncbi:hypothetical protein GC174_17650 [bacterium]|nr:hypothetical protein [bacterium]